MSIQPIQIGPALTNTTLAHFAPAPSSAAALPPDLVVAPTKPGLAPQGGIGSGELADQDRPALLMQKRTKAVGSATPASVVNAQIAKADPAIIFAELALPDPIPTAPILQNLSQAPR